MALTAYLTLLWLQPQPPATAAAPHAEHLPVFTGQGAAVWLWLVSGTQGEERRAARRAVRTLK